MKTDSPVAPSDEILIWQIADSGFPSGGFAHSNGLEANWQFGQVTAETLESWAAAQLTQAARGALPFVCAAYEAVDDVGEDRNRSQATGLTVRDRLQVGGHVECHVARIDQQADQFLNNPVANRASRAQGQAFLIAVVRILDRANISAVHEQLRRSPTHFAPVFGAVMFALGVDRRRTKRLFLFICLRGWLSAAVRLGIIGPLDAQRVQLRLLPNIERLACEEDDRSIDDAAQTAPLLDILHAGHDRLYSRLFQS